jgi:hypothetical protein
MSTRRPRGSFRYGFTVYPIANHRAGATRRDTESDGQEEAALAGRLETDGSDGLRDRSKGSQKRVPPAACEQEEHSIKLSYSWVKQA